MLFRSVLQVANAMSIIARDGIYKNPRLFISDTDPLNEFQTDMDISKATLRTVRDGMYAVVNETGGTANTAFSKNDFDKKDIKIYGKTGSTEKPYNAWFSGFAEDSSGRAIAFALLVKGGQSGAGDAAPLAKDIIRICNEQGYIGTAAVEKTEK